MRGKDNKGVLPTNTTNLTSVISLCGNLLNRVNPAGKRLLGRGGRGGILSVPQCL